MERIILGKHIVDKNYRRFDPVGQSEMCKSCSTGCKTSCSRKLAANMGSEVSYIIPEEDTKKVVAKRFYKVTIVDVDSIPCELKKQSLTLGVDGNILEGEIVNPWPVEWIKETISEYCKKDSHMCGTTTVDLYNPEEPDQLIVCEVESYIEND